LAEDIEGKYQYKHTYGTDVYQELLFELRVAYYHMSRFAGDRNTMNIIPYRE
jgi:hypothetical protein